MMKNRADFLGLIFFSKFVVKHYVFDHHQFLIFSFAIFSWYFPKENTILPINLILHHFFPLFPFSAGPLHKKEQMQTVLSSLAQLYPEISQHCFHLIASRN